MKEKKELYNSICRERSKRRKSIEHYVNDLKVAKKEAEEAKKEAERANKTKSYLLANVSHEIRTPMNVILGMSELILRQETSTEVREKAQNIKSAAKSLLSIINDVLDLSKIESGKMKLINCYYKPLVLFEEILTMFQFPLNEKAIEFIVDIDQTIPCELCGDEIRIRQILINLLGNAVKYTNCGEVHFNVNWMPLEREEGILTICVKDTGVGIKKEDLKRLFNAFERVDTRRNRSKEGSGLGLAICKTLIDLMGGTIQVESTYEKGSTFIVQIKQKVINHKPISADSDKKESKKDGIVQFTAPTAHVLIVDDNLMNLEVAKGLMKIHELNIDTVSSGQECLEILKTRSYDMIFMDHLMPGLDGVDTIRLLHNNSMLYRQDMPIVALTANTVSGVKEIFKKEGFCDYISKPIEVKKLDKVLLRYLPRDLIKVTCKKTQIINKEEHIQLAIPGIDAEQAIANMGGDIELYEELLKVYYKETSNLSERLQELAIEDINLFRIYVHDIKGSTASLGGQQVAQLAEKLEAAAREQNISYITDVLPQFMIKLEKLLMNIHKYLTKNQKTPKQEDKCTAKKINYDELLKIKDGFDNLEIEVIERYMNEVNQYKYTEALQEFIEELTECMENLEYKKGSEKITQYLKRIEK